MIYKIFNRFNIIAVLAISLGFVGCADEETIEFEAPTGNVNAVQPNTLFTATTNADNDLGVIFRSFSTDAASYFWEFGDGSESTEENLDYVYQEGGLFNVVLTTVSSDGLQASDSTLVSPVFVDFTVGEPLDSEVTFENLSTGASSLVWDFGDGETVEWEVEDGFDDPDFSPTHIYTTEDDFEVTLTVTNFLEREVATTKPVTDLVLSTVPDFTFAIAGFTVNFTDASILATSHSWDFGDGSPVSTEINPSHTFPGEGTYEVTLTTTNIEGVERSITQIIALGGIPATFPAVVLNGTFDEFTFNTGDNADAWDMTPNSTVVDNSGATIDSPFAPLWRNSDLDTWLAGFYGDDSEQAGSTSDGNNDTRGAKLDERGRRLYQVVQVEVGVEYTFSIDALATAPGITSEVFILNTQIVDELAINADTNASVVDEYFAIPNTMDYQTHTFTFTPSSTEIVIYVRNVDVIDNSAEAFFDNIEIITPGF